MSLPIAHGLVGASIVEALDPRNAIGRNYRALIIGALLANAADGDFLLVFALRDRSWHRGFTHSLTFAFFTFLVWALLLGKERLRIAVAYGLAYGSHAILDFITTEKERGLELLWPFSSQRFKLGCCGLSEAPSKMTVGEILVALGVEFVIFAPLFLAVVLLRHRRNKTGVVRS